MPSDDGERPAIVTSHRRRFLQGIGATGVAGVLAGCLGGDDEENGGEENGDEENGNGENGDEENGDEGNGDEENGDEGNGDEENGDAEGEVTASFAADPEEGDAPLEVEFDASDSSAEGTSIESYEWDFGDGGSDSGETVTHTYEEGGEYTAELTVAGEDGSSDTASATITVEADVEPDVSIPRVTESPAMDGSLDRAWENAAANELPNRLEGEDDDEILSAEWRGLYDDEHLYVHADVTDDEIVTEGGEPYQRDGVEIYVTPRLDQASSYGEDHAQFVYVFDDDEEVYTVANSHGRTEGIEHTSVETEDGYRVAVAMPWETLGGTPSTNDLITLDVQVNDNDGGDDGRNNKVSWNDDADAAWQDPSSWGVVELSDEVIVTPDASIARVTDAPAVDGSLDGAWGDATAYELSTVLLGEDDPETLSAEWRGLYDDENLYVHADVTDDEIVTEGGEPYQRDGVEIYVTPRNDQASSYGEDHAQFIYVFGDEEVHPGSNSHDRTEGIEHASVETEDGYRVAVAMPWETLGGTPDTNDLITLDVHVNDNDGDDDRDNKISWSAETDDAWQDPSTWAAVELSDN